MQDAKMASERPVSTTTCKRDTRDSVLHTEFRVAQKCSASIMSTACTKVWHRDGDVRDHISGHFNLSSPMPPSAQLRGGRFGTSKVMVPHLTAAHSGLRLQRSWCYVLTVLWMLCCPCRSEDNISLYRSPMLSPCSANTGLQQTFVRDPLDCSLFYTCFGNRYWKMSCATPGTVYSIHFKVCVWRNSLYDDCTQEGETGRTDSTTSLIVHYVESPKPHLINDSKIEVRLQTQAPNTRIQPTKYSPTTPSTPTTKSPTTLPPRKSSPKSPWWNRTLRPQRPPPTTTKLPQITKLPRYSQDQVVDKVQPTQQQQQQHIVPKNQFPDSRERDQKSEGEKRPLDTDSRIKTPPKDRQPQDDTLRKSRRRRPQTPLIYGEPDQKSRRKSPTQQDRGQPTPSKRKEIPHQTTPAPRPLTRKAPTSQAPNVTHFTTSTLDVKSVKYGEERTTALQTGTPVPPQTQNDDSDKQRTRKPRPVRPEHKKQMKTPFVPPGKTELIQHQHDRDQQPRWQQQQKQQRHRQQQRQQDGFQDTKDNRVNLVPTSSPDKQKESKTYPTVQREEPEKMITSIPTQQQQQQLIQQQQQQQLLKQQQEQRRRQQRLRLKQLLLLQQQRRRQLWERRRLPLYRHVPQEVTPSFPQTRHRKPWYHQEHTIDVDHGQPWWLRVKTASPPPQQQHRVETTTRPHQRHQPQQQQQHWWKERPVGDQDSSPSTTAVTAVTTTLATTRTPPQFTWRNEPSFTVTMPPTTTPTTAMSTTPPPPPPTTTATTTARPRPTTVTQPFPWSSPDSTRRSPALPHRQQMAEHCGIMSRPMIIGGKPSRPGQWPWQVSLQIIAAIEPWHRCGGVLIHSSWVLTAAHCVEGPFYGDIRNWRVVLSEDSLEEDSGREIYRRIARIVSHPGYIRTSNFPNDVALLQLDEGVDLSTGEVRVACLPDESTPPPDMGHCWISGWGETRGSGGEENRMNELPVHILENDNCASMWLRVGIHVLDDQLCVGYGDTGACYGDSGGPLMCEMDGRFYITGVMSWLINNCSARGFPNVFTRVTSYLDWIYEKLDFYEWWRYN